MSKSIIFITFMLILFSISISYSQSPIIHKFNYEEIDLNKLQRILMLKTTYWEKLGPIQIYFFDDYLKMNQFTSKLLSMSYTKYKDYVNRIVCEGLAKKPIILQHSICVIQAVRSEKNALGVIDDGIILSGQNLVKFVCVKKYGVEGEFYDFQDN